MSKRITRTLRVTEKLQLTANMIRITLEGDELAGFPSGCEGGYLKMKFPRIESQEDDKAVRSYTVRYFDAEKNRLVVDFVDHGDNGPASGWAGRVETGDEISFGGPGPAKIVEMDHDWFFIAGDMTALPAISVNLEQLPTEARGYAVIEIIDPSDKQDLIKPEGVEIIWVVNPHPDSPNTVLIDAVRECQWLEGSPYVWFAGEFESMRSARAYFKGEREVGRKSIYASSYWKIGEADEGNRAAKKRDADLQG